MHGIIRGLLYVVLPPSECSISRVYSGGKFSIDAANGPVPGPHRVEVHILSRDLSDMKRGKYSMNDAESYTKASPASKGPLTVDIAPDKEIRIDITTQQAEGSATRLSKLKGRRTGGKGQVNSRK